MRILVVSSYPPRHCGIGAYARDQVQRLRAEGHHVTVLAPPDGDGDLTAELLGGRAFARAARVGGAFDRVIVHFQPALYYRPRAAVSKVATSAALWWLVVRRPVHIVVHEADPPIRWRPDYVLLRAAFARAKRLEFHTRAEWSAFEQAYRIRGRGSVIPHAVRPVATVPTRAAARTALGISASGPVFVIPGFLQPSKGIDRVLEAFAGRGDAVLFVVGSIRDRTPENEAYVADLRRRSGTLPRVHLIERFPSDQDFDRWVAAADWILMPYRRSWSSGVLARAQLLGTPAIVTDTGGLREQAGPNDRLVPNDDEAILAAITAAATAETARRASG
ncbi:MAG: glycosyltransferase family 4 protein [Actinomycetota bacterium]